MSERIFTNGGRVWFAQPGQIALSVIGTFDITDSLIRALEAHVLGDGFKPGGTVIYLTAAEAAEMKAGESEAADDAAEIAGLREALGRARDQVRIISERYDVLKMENDGLEFQVECLRHKAAQS